MGKSDVLSNRNKDNISITYQWGVPRMLGYYSTIRSRKGNDLFLATDHQQSLSRICQICKN